ncbi:MAG: glycoside hydrolase family 20 zincin-like fold domain-containing protein [Chitinophagaceae bacterium]
MRNLIKSASFIIISCFIVALPLAAQQKPLLLLRPANASPRVKFAADKLQASLQKTGYSVVSKQQNSLPVNGKTIVIAELSNDLVRKAVSQWNVSLPATPGKEGYIITSTKKGDILVAGADASGVLYGCLALIDQVKQHGQLPTVISITDQPEMVLRGACIGVQKPYYLPGRTVYEYPYTPETFPWLYDKKLWVQYLDSLVSNRMNSLYLWNGHPFASLVRLKEYPYAVEVDDETFKKNEDIYRFITTEADKRGIWVIQMFYNIIVSKPFAEYHHIKTQDRERPVTPLIADYTRKSIAAFVEKYPNVGLMVCLGEAMEGVGNDDIAWFTKTIIPGVQDGLKALGKTAEPPIVLRAHDTDAPSVMKAALPLYKNLYTEAKFNGEALTTPKPRGAWAALHQTLSHLGSVQIENVHILANLEPFRYGSVDFIQQSVKGMHEIMGGNGLHLYPQASYWDWPYSADSVKARPEDPVGRGKRLLQIERDWIWYAAWSRYAWKAGRDRSEEVNYWSGLLAAKFGCSVQDGQNILEAYEESGEIAPKLLRRFGITDGNRQTLTLGMLMTQLINPYRYGLFTLLYESESPEGEMLTQYAEKEWKGEKHTGETPVQIINEVKIHADKAVAAVAAAAKNIGADNPEFERLQNDMYCYQAMAYHYSVKAAAAIHILRYKYSGDIKDLETALPLLEQSVSWYKKLAELTKPTYLYANSMQTQQRKIPIRGVDGTFKTWTEVLVPFENELAHFKHKIDSLKSPVQSVQQSVILKNARVLLENKAGNYKLDSMAKPFSDTALFITALAEELKGLQGITGSYKQQVQEGTSIVFTCKKPVKLLVGFFNGKNPAFAKQSVYLKAPELETNASANDYGQADTKIANAVVIKGMPAVNVHSYSFPAGKNTLKLAKGVCLVLGFVDAEQPVPLYDAGLTEKGASREIDWLFE